MPNLRPLTCPHCGARTIPIEHGPVRGVVPQTEADMREYMDLAVTCENCARPIPHKVRLVYR